MNRYIRRFLGSLAQHVTISDYDEYCNAGSRHRALLSYLVTPLLPPPPLRDRTRFSNRGMAQEIARALNELGFVVDIVNLDNTTWRPTRAYDLFVGHAGINFEHISRQLPSGVPRIYYSTSLYWKEFNAREAKRFYDLASRRGFFLPPDRAITCSEEYAVQASDGIITLGNEVAIRSYSQFRNVIGINNAAFPVTWQGWQHKDYAEGRNHFLFFSGNGNVHKGLDLLLEAFAQTDLHLHICQRMEAPFLNVYRHELSQLANIHLHDFVRMRSAEFYELAEKCNWIISATCAEGSPGAVVECMAHGLIPILPDAATIDLEDWGYRIEALTVEAVRAVIAEVAASDVVDCRTRAEKVMQATRERYSPETFRQSFKEAVKQIMSTGGSTEAIN